MWISIQIAAMWGKAIVRGEETVARPHVNVFALSLRCGVQSLKVKNSAVERNSFEL